MATPGRQQRSALSPRTAALIAAFSIALGARAALSQVVIGSGPLDVEPEAQGIAVLNVTPNETVYLLGVSRDYAGGVVQVVEWRLTQADTLGAGAVHFDLGQAPPLRSSWVAIEANSGRFGSGSGDPASPAPVLPELQDGLSSSGSTTTIGLDRFSSALLIVRPTIAAWSVDAGDGGPTDGDGQINGGMSVLVGSGEPFNAGGILAPQELTDGDIVAAIDPVTLAVNVVRMRCADPSGCLQTF